MQTKIGNYAKKWVEIKEFIRFFLAGGADVVFYCGSLIDEIWMRTTIRECRARGIRCALIVATAKSLLKEYSGQNCLYQITGRLLRLLDCKVFVSASSGLQRERMPDGCRYRVHMPHSLVSLHMAYPEDSFDGFNYIFACGEHHTREAGALTGLRGLPDWRALPVGYGKIDILNDCYKQLFPSKSDSQATVVIAPSWGRNNILEALGVQLVETLLSKKHKVIIRPHPAFFSMADNAIVLDALLGRFDRHADFSLENPNSEERSIYEADILISDYSGVALEYSFVRERPVIFVDVPKKIMNKKWGNLGVTPLEVDIREKIGIIAKPTVEDVIDSIEKLCAAGDDYRRAIRGHREKFVYNYGRCGQVAADKIEEMLKDVPQEG